MFDLTTLYKPITAHPFMNNVIYGEYSPCEALKPFVRCFWGSSRPSGPNTAANVPLHIIPDSCMDILIEINHTDNEMTLFFTGIQTEPFTSQGFSNNKKIVSVFAVRFNFWAAHLFLEFDPAEVNRMPVDMAEAYPFWYKEFECFFEITSIEARIAHMEKFLLKRLNEKKFNDNAMNGIYYILKNKGLCRVQEISEYAYISPRHMERVFKRNTGLTLKQASDLVRYQFLWQDIVFKNIHIQDLVYKYGYSDQSHLLKNFYKFHGMYPKDAKIHAYKL